MLPPLRVAILVSGEGTTLESLAGAIEAGRVPARIVLVVSDRANAPALAKAAQHRLATLVRPITAGATSDEERALSEALRSTGAELVVLAGFLSVLPAPFVREWAGRIVNVHPSLLPKFGGVGMYGSHVHAAVLASGASESGVSVHLVTEDVDQGPVLLQERFPVRPGDSIERLRERARPIEHSLVEETVRRFAEGRWPLPYAAPPLRGRLEGVG